MVISLVSVGGLVAHGPWTKDGLSDFCTIARFFVFVFSSSRVGRCFRKSEESGAEALENGLLMCGQSLRLRNRSVGFASSIGINPMTFRCNNCEQFERYVERKFAAIWVAVFWTVSTQA